MPPEAVFGNSGGAPDSGQATGGVGDQGDVFGSNAGAPEGGNDAGNQPQDGQAQAPGQGQQPGQGQPAQLILGKFKTHADLEAGYRNLEANYTRLAQERMILLRGQPQGQSQGQQVPAHQQGQPQQPDYGAMDQVLATEWQQSPAKAIANFVKQAIQNEVKPLLDQSLQPIQQRQEHAEWRGQVDAMIANPKDYPGFTELAPQIEQILRQDPYLIKAPGGRGIQMAYFMARGMTAGQAMQAAEEAGRQAAYQGIQQKTGAQVEGGGARQQTAKSPEEQLLDSIFAPTKGGGVFG